jgi:acyl-CoA reductase-like NAD-dependent aldehyde dehydrogenase
VADLDDALGVVNSVEYGLSAAIYTRGIEQFSQLKTVYVDYSGRLQKAQIDTHPLEDRA